MNITVKSLRRIIAEELRRMLEASSAVEKFAADFYNNIKMIPHDTQEEQDGSLSVNWVGPLAGKVTLSIHEDEKGAYALVNHTRIDCPISAAGMVDGLLSGRR